MDRTERFYRIEQLLTDRKIVPLEGFLQALEISRATFKRDLEYLRDRLHAPIVWDRETGGYRIEQAVGQEKFQLPGLWFNASEVHALLTMQQLLTSLGPGLLTPHVEPLLVRLRTLIKNENMSLDAFEKRIRIQRLNARTYEPEHFPPIITAVLQRKRLVIEHHNKFRNETLQREVSPQRLNHYQENWYLDAWCHLRHGLRSFALDAISGATIKEEAAVEIADQALVDELDAGYGVFSGGALDWAELAFTAERARWVSKEIWHPEQISWVADDGTYHLKLPFSDLREIGIDILRHAGEVRVLAPLALQEHVKERLRTALTQF